MKNVKNEKIINVLIDINHEYEKKLDNFAFKFDPEAVFNFECTNYVALLTERMVPLVAQYLEHNPYDSIENYLPYINPKYHDTFATDIKMWKKRELDALKQSSKNIIKAFTNTVLPYSTKTAEEKNEFIMSFTARYELDLMNMCKIDTELFLTTVANLCNPRLQYFILNVLDKEMTHTTTTFLTSVNQKALDKILETLVCYPTNITMEEYFDKWVGKDKIYVKFLKNNLGGRYEYAKLFVKMAQKKKRPKSMSLDKDE